MACQYVTQKQGDGQTFPKTSQTVVVHYVGVQRRLRHQNPFAVYINCRNHRLALCLVHLIKQFPLLQDVDSALLSLWKLFEYSPQKLAVFKHIQSVYGQVPLAITRAATTRWLSHLQASSRFISRYVCILDTLDALYADKREPDLQGIRASITDKKTVATILLLCDILKPVNMLSLYLQETSVNFADLPSHVHATIESLSALVDIYRRYAGNMAESGTDFARCSDLFFEIDERTNLQRRLRAGEDTTPDAFLEEIGIPLVYDLMQEIQDAFCTGDPVLTAFGFFNPQNFPENLTDLQEYGHESIQKLVTFYGTARRDTFKGHVTEVPALMDPVQLETELKSVRTQMFMLRKNGRNSVEGVYRAFSQDPVLAECFPLCHRLIYYTLIIPPSTAVVERSFSLMSNIMTKKRNRLCQRQLDAVTRVSHQDRQLDDHDLEALVDKFNAKKSRRLDLD